MDNILPTYNDPLFSIFIVIVLVLLTAIASNLVGSYKEGKRQRSLQNFLGQIRPDAESLEINKIPFEPALIYPLTRLAETLTSQGEYQKSVDIYLYLIQNISSFEEKEHILEAFGRTYLKGGFLKRAEAVFLEILHKHPRNREALFYLEVVYEMLNDTQKAISTLKPLEIMGEHTERLEAHLALSSLQRDTTLSREERIEKLLSYLKEGNHSYRHIMQLLFRLDAERAWRVVQEEKIPLILDILWFLPTSNINFDIISKSELLVCIYRAKGLLDLKDGSPKSGIFAIDTMVAARRGGSRDLDLHFSYGCSRCKGEFPISFIRCPNCYALDSIQIKERIAKKRSQTGYSLL